MSKIVFSGILVFLLIFFITFYTAYNQATFVAKDNEVALDNATRNALSDSINVGHLRVNEEVTIDPQMAKESLIRNYAQSVNYQEGDRFLNIYYISEQPILAVDAYTSLEGTTNFTSEQETISRSRNVYIIEAKDITR